jgi:hypothetical protein
MFKQKLFVVKHGVEGLLVKLDLQPLDILSLDIFELAFLDPDETLQR